MTILRSHVIRAAAAAVAVMVGAGVPAVSAGSPVQTPPGSVVPVGNKVTRTDYITLTDKTATLVYPGGFEIGVVADAETDQVIIGNGTRTPMEPVWWWGQTGVNDFYTPASVLASNGFQVEVSPTSSCAVTVGAFQTCPATGTLTFNFNRAVTDGVIHLSNICANWSFGPSGNTQPGSGQSAALRIDKANSTYTSGDVTFEKVSGNTALQVSATRVGAPQNTTGGYSLDLCGYGSVKVKGTYTKITMVVDVDWYVINAFSQTDAYVRSNGADGFALNWTAQEGDVNPYVNVQPGFKKADGTHTATLDSGFYKAGQVLDVQYVVSNPGFVALAGPHVVTDSKVKDITCPTTAIAPGASVICTAKYTVTAADVTAKSISLSASVSTTATGGATVTAAAVTATASIDAAKAAAEAKSVTGAATTRKNAPGLPSTGAASTPLLLAALALLVSGAALLVFRRRSA